LRLLLLAALLLGGIGGGAYVAWSRLAVGPVTRGTAAYQRGEWDRAAALADERLKSAPGDKDAIRLAARAAGRLRRDTAARSLYGRLGGPSAMRAEDFYLFGAIFERMGDDVIARECWQQGLRLDPGHPEIIAGFARFFVQTKQLARAATFAKELAMKPGWEARGDLVLGSIEAERDEPARAAEALGRALSRDPSAAGAPESPSNYRRLFARSLLRIGKAAEAVPALRAVLASGPDPETSWLLSRAYLQSGQLAEAAVALKESGDYRERHEVAFEPSPALGAARCAECHPVIYKSEQDSLHAQTFWRGAGLEKLPMTAAPVSDPALRGIQYELKKEGRKVHFDAREKDAVRRAVVEFAFGSGNHGITLVGKDADGRSCELRLSHYADGPAWDLTSGQPPTPPPGESVLGRPLGPDEVGTCLACHTTDPRSARDGAGPMGADHGIGCERCHGPGEAHVKAVAAKFPDPAIARPRLATAPQVVALCAGCHSPFGREVLPSDPLAVRFPGTALTWSRCYAEGGGSLSCVTCHDPHKNAETAPAYYESKCLSCHAKPSAQRPEKSRGVACPVNPAQDCLSCHMPKVKTIIPHTLFTDHHIRVRSSSNPKSERPRAAGH
jgi:tetratricopeptide (TPR) repeat protein